MKKVKADKVSMPDPVGIVVLNDGSTLPARRFTDAEDCQLIIISKEIYEALRAGDRDVRELDRTEVLYEIQLRVF